MFSPECRINARRQFDLDGPLESVELTPEELLSDDGRLEAWLDDSADEWTSLSDEPAD